MRYERVKIGQVELAEYAYLSRLIDCEADSNSRRAMIESVNRLVNLDTVQCLI